MIKMCTRLQSLTLSLCSISAYTFSSSTPSSTPSQSQSAKTVPSSNKNNPFNKQPPTKSKLKILKKTPINHDSYIYRLAWQGPKFPLTIGQHFRIIQTIPTKQHPEGQEIIRKYTPISPCSTVHETMDLLLKIYRPNTSKEFPQGGKLTPYLEKLNIGDFINIDGPYGKFGYKQGGIVIINGKQHKINRIFFIAGGSGITPCYQTLRQIISMPSETQIQLILLFANKSQQDILLRQQLQKMQPRLKLYYSLDVAPQKWQYFSGYATKQMLQNICPLNDKNTLYVYCGPRGMNVLLRNMFQKYYPESLAFKY